MTAQEYEHIYHDFIMRRKEFLSVKEVEKLYDKVFLDNKPTYLRLHELEFKMLLLDLCTMFSEGRTDGIEYALEQRKDWILR